MEDLTDRRIARLRRALVHFFWALRAQPFFRIRIVTRAGWAAVPGTTPF
jgi:hypothetical protein